MTGGDSRSSDESVVGQLTLEPAHQELLHQWSIVAANHSTALHFKFQADYRPSVIQQRAQEFVDSPSRANFERFWGLLHSAARAASPSAIYTKWHEDREASDEELAALIDEIRTADAYNPEWESTLGARKSLWELFGVLHIEECPIVNNSTIHGLQFFGYQGGSSYKAVVDQFERFERDYLQIVDHATEGTEHQVPRNFEIDQLFNVIDKVVEDDLSSESAEDVQDFYQSILELKAATDDGTEDVFSGQTESVSTPQIWQISPGRDGNYWENWRDNGYVSIGFPDVERPAASDTEQHREWARYENEPVNSGEGMLYRFHREVDTDDIVVAKTGTKGTKPDTIYGIGIVTGTPYEEADDVGHHQDKIPVDWIEVFGPDGIEINLTDSSDSIKSYTLDDLDERYYTTLLETLEEELDRPIGDVVRIDSPATVDRSYYWVNQTNIDEIEAEYLSAGVDGHWSHDLTVLDKGNVVFHYHDSALVGYSTVTEEAWEVEGETGTRYRVTVDFHRLEQPRPLEAVREELSKPALRGDVTGYPITKAGSVQQAYLCSLSTAAGEYLLEELDVSLTTDINYFWVSANPSMWHPDEINDGGEIFYTAYSEDGHKRQRFAAFEAARPGDRVIFYVSSPERRIVSEGKVVEGLHEGQSEDGELVDGITLKHERSLEPVQWDRLQDHAELSAAEPVRSNAQGSLFELTADEFETLLELGSPSAPPAETYEGVEEAVDDITSRLSSQPSVENVLESQLSAFIIEDWTDMLRGVEPSVELSPAEETKAEQLLSMYRQHEQELTQLATELGSGRLDPLDSAATLFVALFRESQARAELTPNLNQVKLSVLEGEQYTVEQPTPVQEETETTDDVLPTEEKPKRAETIRRQLTKTGQVVFYGPPGTGKTYTARRFAHWWLNEQSETPSSSQLRTVTFHPSFSYEDFIEGLTATESDSGGVTYEIVPGVFKRFAERAREAYQEAGPDEDAQPYVLIIDEINRGNLSQIFGETITGLEMDKRLGGANQTQISLAHSKASFTIPPNLYLIGTMNTADRSIALVDAALRRRFRFLSFPPEYEVLYELHGFDGEANVIEAAQHASDPYRQLLALSIDALGRINGSIREAADLGKGNQIGHSYLLDIDTVTEIVETWRYEILPLLEEYYFGQIDRIRTEVFNGGGEALFDWQYEEIADFTAQELTETLAHLCGYDGVELGEGTSHGDLLEG